MKSRILIAAVLAAACLSAGAAAEEAAPTETTAALVEAPSYAVVGSGISWSADDINLGVYNSTLELNGLYIGAGSGADENGKPNETVIIDEGSAAIDGRVYERRIKTGGMGNPETGARCLYFKPDRDCSMLLDAVSSNSSEERVVYAGDEVFRIAGNVKMSYVVTGIKAGETVRIYTETGGLNVYGIMLLPLSAELPATAAPEETCLKITAVYAADKTLESVKLERASLSAAASAARIGKTVIMYWSSAEGMVPSVSAPPPATAEPPLPENPISPQNTVSVGGGARFSADELEAGTYYRTIERNGFFIGADAGTDSQGKQNGTVIVDSNKAEIGGNSYSLRIKTVGQGYPETGKRCVYFRPDSDCSLTLDAASSNTGQTRDVIVLHGGTAEHIAIADKTAYALDGLKANEDVVIYSVKNGLNIYGITLTPAEVK